MTLNLPSKRVTDYAIQKGHIHVQCRPAYDHVRSIQITTPFQQQIISTTINYCYTEQNKFSRLKLGPSTMPNLIIFQGMKSTITLHSK